jgi:glycolate oxidase FAD binding subunit
MSQPTCSIDESEPLPVYAPAGVEELAECVRDAGHTGRAIYPVGGRTSLHLGYPPSRPGLAVDTRQLAGVIDYPARDMTITVQAGLTVAQLDAVLRAEGQRLPVDVPCPEQATVGGAIAVNASGPRRHGLGTFRDYVLGLSLVNDQGQQVKSGGRVVKNVAGYDIHKLMVGSLGTLGIITQVTFKLKPRPEASAIVAMACPTPRLGELLDTLHRSRTYPVALELVNAATLKQLPGVADLPPAEWYVLVGYEEKATTVRDQVARLSDEARAAHVEPIALTDGRDGPLWASLVRSPQGIAIKANLLPSAVAAFCQQLTQRQPEAAVQAHAGVGIVLAQLPPTLPFNALADLLQWLQESAQAASGNVVVVRCPPAWKGDLPLWGSPRGDWPLMRAIKAKLDPRGLFNPGRFIDRL